MRGDDFMREINKRLLSQCLLHLVLVVMYFYQVNTNFGELFIWVLPLFFLSLYFDSLATTILVFIHGLVIAMLHMGEVSDQSTSAIMHIAFATIVTVFFKAYIMLYKGLGSKKIIAFCVASMLPVVLVLYVGLIMDNYDYVMGNLFAAIYVGVFSAGIPYVYKRQGESIAAERLENEGVVDYESQIFSE